MRNLKRALSLTLASVMLLGMMVLGTSAASYPDVTDEHNVEAIEVLQAVGVMSGSNSGNFNPDSKVSRIEMAIVMANLLDLDVDYFQGQNQFSDVPEWASGYVNACAASGIVTGVGGGRFGTGNVTATQAALMMLKALGYFQYNSDFGGDWARATANQAAKLRLFDGIEVRDNTQLTRNQVAQLALNALKTPVVEPDDDTLHITTPDGITVSGGNVKYVVTASAKDYAYAIDDTESNGNALNGINGGVIELGEKLYNGDLKLNDRTSDDFNRPARRWEYEGKEVGVYAKKEDMRAEYTKEVTGRDLYDLLGSSIIDDSRWTINVSVDGESRYSATNGSKGVSTVFNRTYMRKDNKKGVGDTGKGVLTQVFVDADKKIVDIAVINTYLAKADANYNSNKDEVTFKVHGIDLSTDSDGTKYYWKHMAGLTGNADPGSDKLIPASGEDFAVENIKKDDIYRVTVADGVIQTLNKVETVEAVTLDAFKLDDYVTAGDVTYDYAKNARYDVEVLSAWTGNDTGVSNLKDKKYNIYLDAYGYLLGVDLAEGEDNYVFITGVDGDNSNLSAKDYKANAIFLDGTMKTITVDNSNNELKAAVGKDNALHNRWYTYTVNSKDVYKLGAIASADKDNGGTSPINTSSNPKVKIAQNWVKDGAAAEINVKHVSLTGATKGTSYKNVYANDDTVFLSVETKTIDTKGQATSTDYRGVIDKVESVVTGIKNADLAVLKQGTSVSDADSAWKLAKGSGSLEPQKNDDFAYGTYVLYKDNGYVIAAVSVAASGEASDNLVYVNSSKINRETYSSDNDEWTWEREVIANGEKTTITERDTAPYELRKLVQYNWYKVSYDSKGEVVRIEHAVDARDARDGATTQNYQNEISKLPATIQNGKSTILFEAAKFTGHPGADCPKASEAASVYNTVGSKLEGSTFYAFTNSESGVYVDESVKTVLIQEINKKTETMYYDGTSGLKSVLDILDNDERGYSYEISMIVTDGRAKVVVIRDMLSHGTPGTPGTPSATSSLISSDKSLKAGANDDAATVNRDSAIKVVVAKNGDVTVILNRAGDNDTKMESANAVITIDGIEAAAVMTKTTSQIQFKATGYSADENSVITVDITKCAYAKMPDVPAAEDPRSDYSAAYESAGIEITPVAGTNNVKISAGTKDELETYIKNASNAGNVTLMTHVIDTTSYLFAGVSFKAPVDKAGDPAASCDVDGDHYELDAAGSHYLTEGTSAYLHQYVGVCSYTTPTASTTVSKLSPNTFDFTITWNFEDGTSVTMNYQVIRE